MSSETGTPLLSTSKTAERARDCSTISRRPLGRVTFHGEVDRDLLVTVADLVGHPDDALQVDVAGDRRLDAGEGDTAGSGDIGHPSRDARREPAQRVLQGRGAVVLPHENGGVVGVEHVLGVVLVFLTSAGEPLADPLAVGPGAPAGRRPRRPPSSASCHHATRSSTATTGSSFPTRRTPGRSAARRGPETILIDAELIGTWRHRWAGRGLQVELQPLTRSRRTHREPEEQARAVGRAWSRRRRPHRRRRVVSRPSPIRCRYAGCRWS